MLVVLLVSLLLKYSTTPLCCKEALIIKMEESMIMKSLPKPENACAGVMTFASTNAIRLIRIIESGGNLSNENRMIMTMSKAKTMSMNNYLLSVIT